MQQVVFALAFQFKHHENVMVCSCAYRINAATDVQRTTDNFVKKRRRLNSTVGLTVCRKFVHSYTM